MLTGGYHRPMFELPSGRMSGASLRAVLAAMRHTPAKHVISKVFRAQLGIDALSALSAEMVAPLPQSFLAVPARLDHRRPSQELSIPAPGEAVGARQLHETFHACKASPLKVTELALESLAKLDSRHPPMNPFLNLREAEVLEDARASDLRYRTGTSLGPLDGVIIPIKEEMDVRGLPTRLGTAWLPTRPAQRDSVAVARLRSAGALILGNTVMTEYGMSPIGVNPHRVMPRNVYDPRHVAGGSSTGSAVAVALGLAPAALGTDGGGSIRVPAAYNGLFGLKPTYGRIPLVGHGTISGSSVVHAGPIGATTEDLALFLEVTAGPDPQDTTSLAKPHFEPGELQAALRRGVRGLRIGLDEEQWASAPESIARPARDALEALEADGAELVTVRSRLALHATAIGYLTIGLEGYAALRDVRTHLHDLSLELQLTLLGLDSFRPDDYIIAQRLRGELRKETAGLLTEVDVLALPTTASLPPSVTDAEAVSSFVDPHALDSLSRYVYLGNLTGIPAGTAPVGFVDGLPVGLQILGDAWDEACVLQVMAHLERTGIAQVRRPPGYLNLLETATASS